MVPSFQIGHDSKCQTGLTSPTLMTKLVNLNLTFENSVKKKYEYIICISIIAPKCIYVTSYDNFNSLPTSSIY